MPAVDVGSGKEQEGVTIWVLTHFSKHSVEDDEGTLRTASVEFCAEDTYCTMLKQLLLMSDNAEVSGLDVTHLDQQKVAKVAEDAAAQNLRLGRCSG